MAGVLRVRALEVGSAVVPLRAVFCGPRWCWRGFALSGGAWRLRRWGMWPVFRPDTYVLAVRPEDEQRVREGGLATASLSLPANTRVELLLPVRT